ncbi:hypothetical protein BDZ90DRAFT_57494 [Jaminaea rosea]|uniref:Uncharacterized protein n=1 Tax=Jaminaea rosea TaxID=1569628 RepID=A0A316ULD8_9BASI|nr:hypothetical protein BDZ90DRAFT_57494 [Jaminaea rosea]PWN26059.1 hypothetical protein BDZ90DRAFT_57494 [Jaminaea rosea]
MALPTSMVAHQPEDINYAYLLHLLSTPPCLPTSTTVRNHLLAAVTSRTDLFSASLDSLSVIDDPWKDFTTRYQPGAQLVVIGSPPVGVLKSGRGGSSSSSANNGHQAGIWGLGILVSSKFRDEADPTTCLRRPNMSIWLSTEMACSARGEDDPTTRGMVHFLFSQWLPVAYKRFIEAQRDHFALDASEVEREHLREVDIIIQAMDELQVDVLADEVCQARRDEDSLRGPSSNRPWIEWRSGAYDAFVLDPPPIVCPATPEEEAKQAGQRWQLERITTQTAKAVAEANKIPFPVSHTLRKPHLSLLARDATGPVGAAGAQKGSEEDVYPIEQAKGSLAGWVYTHEDMSLASLHVALPYRRRVEPADSTASSAAPPPAPLSLGRLLVTLLSPRIGLAQRRALTACGVDVAAIEAEATQGEGTWCPWPVTAHVDASDQGAVRFYEKLGCTRMAKHVWLGLKAPLRGAGDQASSRTG